MNEITKCVSTKNTTYKANRSIKYIVLHYTAGTTSKAGAAINTAKYFSGGNAAGSADFIVDDATIVQYNGDIKNRYCWSVGGNKYGTMSTSDGGKYYNVCTNINSVSIEMCSNKKNTKSLSATDTDWYLTEDTINNAVELTKYIMSIYDIPSENVIMHHHVTGKVCPNPWCVSENRLSGWNDFKKKLINTDTETVTVKENEEMIETINLTVNGKEIKADAIVKNGETFLKLRALENAGFKVGFNADTKMRTIDNEIKELPITVDGKETSIEAINVADLNYTPIRSIAAALDVRVGYENKKVTLEKCY